MKNHEVDYVKVEKRALAWETFRIATDKANTQYEYATVKDRKIYNELYWLELNIYKEKIKEIDKEE